MLFLGKKIIIIYALIFCAYSNVINPQNIFHPDNVKVLTEIYKSLLNPNSQITLDQLSKVLNTAIRNPTYEYYFCKRSSHELSSCIETFIRQNSHIFFLDDISFDTKTINLENGLQAKISNIEILDRSDRQFTINNVYATSHPVLTVKACFRGLEIVTSYELKKSSKICSSGDLYITFEYLCATGQFTLAKRSDGFIMVTDSTIIFDDYSVKSTSLDSENINDQRNHNIAASYIKNNEYKIVKQMEGTLKNGITNYYKNKLNEFLACYLFDIVLPY